MDNYFYILQEPGLSAGAKESIVPVCFWGNRYATLFWNPPAEGSDSGCAVRCAGYEAPVPPDQYLPRSVHKVPPDEYH